MTTYRIVCTEQQLPTTHNHIIAVGVGAEPSRAAERLTVEQVRSALDRGDTFYTQSPSTQKIAYVDKYQCHCGRGTIRSRPDAVVDNNLDNLRICRF